MQCSVMSATGYGCQGRVEYSLPVGLVIRSILNEYSVTWKRSTTIETMLCFFLLFSCPQSGPTVIQTQQIGLMWVCNLILAERQNATNSGSGKKRLYFSYPPTNHIVKAVGHFHNKEK